MLAPWYLLLGQFSVTFEYRPGAQHANMDGMSRQCGQCQRLDCPVSAQDSPAPEEIEDTEEIEMDQPFGSTVCSVRNRLINGRGPSAGVIRRNLGGLSTDGRIHG